MPQLHPDWVRRISYVGHNHSFISCSNSPTNSLVMRDVGRKRKSYIFRVRKVGDHLPYVSPQFPTYIPIKVLTVLIPILTVLVPILTVQFQFQVESIFPTVFPLQGVLCFDYSHQLEILVTGSIDHVVRLWNPYVPSKPMAVLRGHSTAVLDVVVASGCGLIFSYSHDAVSCMYSASTTCSHLYTTPVISNYMYLSGAPFQSG